MILKLDSLARTNTENASTSSSSYSTYANATPSANKTYSYNGYVGSGSSISSAGNSGSFSGSGSGSISSSGSGSGSSSGSGYGSGSNSSGSGSGSGIFYDKKNYYPDSKLNTSTSIIDRLQYNDFDSSFSARSDYYKAMGFSGTYTGSDKQNGQMLSWMKDNGYRNGKYRLTRDELAWTQEGRRMEAIIRPSDGAILTPLAQNDSVLRASATSNIFNFANDPSGFIRDNLNIGSIVSDAPSQNIGGNTYDNDFNMHVVLPNIKNYEQFKHDMQHDPNFEKMVRAMTVDKMFGGSSLKKYKH
jgi:hypothetical protein